ncbi:MAG: MerR family transcriptional regulator [Erythrobacter sp.]|jgi:DNA-binding transcriptional MerR regulator|nr:MerR family transcriptional regulator [Erythrobacter sp.]
MAEFDDGKDEAALRTIGEVSEGLGIKPHVLRYWEQQFSGLRPLKRSGGRRYYRAGDVALVEEINRLVNEEGYTLKGAEGVLRSRGRSGADRRQSERRADERRREEADEANEAEGAPGRAAATVSSRTAPSADQDEVLGRLKAIRQRLASAIDL